MDTDPKPPTGDAPAGSAGVDAPRAATAAPVPGRAARPAPRTLKRNALLSGVGVGLGYGLLTYFAFRAHGQLASIAYLGVVPMVMGAIPLLFTDVDQIENYLYILLAPWLAMIGVFAV